MNNIIRDPRIDQVRKIVESLVSRTMFQYTQVLVTRDNNLILIVNQTLLYEIPLKDIREPYPEASFIYNDIVEFEDTNSCYNDSFLGNIMNQIYNRYKNIQLSNNIVAIDSDLRNNNEFEKLLNLKSDQGMKYFKMPGLNINDTYLIPMFSGFISLSKPDTIGMKIYDILDGFLLVEMDIFKKKINREIKLYCRIMKL